MKKKIEEIIEVPEGFVAEVDGNLIIISKDGKTIEKKLPFHARKENNRIIIGDLVVTKKNKKLIKTASAHVRNMIAGLNKKFIYKLQVCSVHFPMNVSVKGNEFIIKNFLGEVKERKAKILSGVEVKIEKDIVIVEGIEKDNVGQTAANIENAVIIRAKDRRIFQDGIFIIEKEKGVKK